jgi:hypothetical protein
MAIVASEERPRCASQRRGKQLAVQLVKIVDHGEPVLVVLSSAHRLECAYDVLHRPTPSTSPAASVKTQPDDDIAARVIELGLPAF